MPMARVPASAGISRALLVCLLPALGVAAPARAQDPEPKRVAAGVSVAGVDVGGLTLPETAARVEVALGRRLRSPVLVRVAGRRFRLRPPGVGFHFAADRTARRAYRAGLELVSPATVDVDPFVTMSRRKVARWVARVGRRTVAPARNATLRITMRRMIRRKGRNGRALVQYRLRGAIARVLRDPREPRSVRGRRRPVRPRITHAALSRIYRTVVTVDRRSFRLRLFKRLRYRRSYPVAVGAAGYETPSGMRRVVSRQVNPPWTAPNRPWAGSYAGRTVPGGAPDNPLKARWLGLGGGVGIHGTGESFSIGSRASHGCIRMYVSDVIDLYPRVPLGTPVLIR